MSKQEQVLILEPSNELRFKGPFREPVTRHLKLANPTAKKICFKVKTTAPKRYCVRPNCGLIEPNSNVSVAVMLQPFDFEPNEKNKHKFMVQSMYVPDGDINQDQLWKDVQPDQLMDSKLKCVFELPTDLTSHTDVTSTSTVDDKKVAEKPQAKVSNIEAELRRAAEEVKQLRDENSGLLRENLKLKDDSIRLRKEVDGRSASPPPPLLHAPQPPAPAVSGFMMMMALLCVIFGIVFGKLFL